MFIWNFSKTFNWKVLLFKTDGPCRELPDFHRSPKTTFLSTFSLFYHYLSSFSNRGAPGLRSSWSWMMCSVPAGAFHQPECEEECVSEHCESGRPAEGVFLHFLRALLRSQSSLVSPVFHFCPWCWNQNWPRNVCYHLLYCIFRVELFEHLLVFCQYIPRIKCMIFPDQRKLWFVWLIVWAAIKPLLDPTTQF